MSRPGAIDAAAMDDLEAALRHLERGDGGVHTLTINRKQAANLLMVLDNHPLGEFVREHQAMKARIAELEQEIVRLRDLGHGLSQGSKAVHPLTQEERDCRAMRAAFDALRACNPFEGGAAAILAARVKAMAILEEALGSSASMSAGASEPSAGMGESAKPEGG